LRDRIICNKIGNQQNISSHLFFILDEMWGLFVFNRRMLLDRFRSFYLVISVKLAKKKKI